MTHRSGARSALSGALAVALVATATASIASATPDDESSGALQAPVATTQQQAGADGGGDGTVHTLTLVTGDVVTVTELADGSHTVDVETPAGRGYQTLTVGDELHVLPDSARDLVAAGVLDADLFNVTALIEQGVGAEGAQATPIIVQFDEEAEPTSVASRLGTPTAALESINAVALRAEPDGAQRLWSSLTTDDGQLAPGISAVHLDGLVEASLADSVPQIGAPRRGTGGSTGRAPPSRCSTPGST